MKNKTLNSLEMLIKQKNNLLKERKVELKVIQAERQKEIEMLHKQLDDLEKLKETLDIEV